eukprot:UN32675
MIVNDWETLPLGDVGLRPPSGDLGEEPHILEVKYPRVFVSWRTEMGKIAGAYSSDGGETFEPSFWMTFQGTVDGQMLRNPRGSFTPKRLSDGYYVLIYYNNGHTEREGYCCRRFYWLTVGRR